MKIKSKIGTLLALALFALVPATQAISYQFNVEMTGAAEVGPGDPDGFGMGTLTINAVTNEIMWDIVAGNLADIVGFHIHNAPVGVNGGVVFNFNSMLSGSGVDVIAQAILASPTDYYLNLHTTEFPGGAVRGQLNADPQMVPDSSSAALGGLALGMMLLASRRFRRSRD